MAEPASSSGSDLSWGAFRNHGAPGGGPAEFVANFSVHPKLPDTAAGRDCEEVVRLQEVGVSPLDEHNVRLLDHVAPRGWVDPTPEPGFVYDLIAIGAGAGGLVSSKQSARRGARSALIESHLAGGDCLNVGCVPSKALIRAARAVKEVRTHSKDMGVEIAGQVEVNFARVMERMRRLRATIAPADSYKTSAAVGVDCYQGRATFTARDALEVNGQTLRFKKAVIATGGSPALPHIAGLSDCPYTTNASLFNLTSLPPRIAVLGGGPIGLEMAQAMALFGSDVTVLLRGSKLLPKEDPDAAELVESALLADGVRIVRDVVFERIEHTEVGTAEGWPLIQVHTSVGGAGRVFGCELLLVATGRKPNVEGLGLEAAGVEFDVKEGVHVNQRLETSNPNIFAVGDVCTELQFTHVSGAMAGIVVENALFEGDRRFDKTLVPWCTFTEPEVAHTGLYEADFAARGIECETWKTDLQHNDRAILESSTSGFCKVHCRKGTDEILGGTIVGPSAGDLISELTVAIQAKIGLGVLGRVIHPYPTVAECIQACGISYNRTQWKKL
mmetsp:Transcript_30094/g.70163  ORF Transcript_30094/g.70163 Transcript_30094/m.70163 type:complete len:557 (+) Transcript_30094:91-1761(+)